jgi:hypothetical protein
MLKNLKFLSIFLLTSPVSSFGITYSCPTVSTGDYISYVSDVSGWHLYMLDQDYLTKNNFSLRSNINWDAYYSNRVSTTAAESILVCNTEYEGGFLNAMKYVKHPNCIDNSDGTFTCQ